MMIPNEEKFQSLQRVNKQADRARIAMMGLHADAAFTPVSFCLYRGDTHLFSAPRVDDKGVRVAFGYTKLHGWTMR